MNLVITSVVRLNTATLYPWSAMFSARFSPITANPISPTSAIGCCGIIAFPLKTAEYRRGRKNVRLIGKRVPLMCWSAARVPYDRLVFRVHAIQRMFERGIGETTVRDVLQNGEEIESYPDDLPYPS